MMSVKNTLAAWIVMATTMAYLSSLAHGQRYQPFGPVNHTHTLQPFAPVNDNLLYSCPKPNEGYFFNYERLNWSVSKPMRSPIGAAIGPLPVTVPFTPSIVPAPDQNTVLNPASLLGSDVAVQFNSIDVAIPRTEFGWGNRFELGYMVDGSGWTVGVLDGPKQGFSANYGFDGQRLGFLAGATGTPGVDGIPFDDPLIDRFFGPDDAARPGGPVDADEGVDPIPNVPGVNSIPAVDGYREVGVTFADPFGLITGFVDFNNDLFPDDRDGDGIFGNAGQDTDGDGVPDTTAPTDLDDALSLATYFDRLSVHNRTKISGVELVKTKRMAPTWNGSIIEWFFGVRYLEIDDRFGLTGLGGNVGDMSLTNHAHNRIVGPQIGMRHYHQRGRWKFALEGRFMAGANFMSVDQQGTIGTLIIPGAIGFPIGLMPQAFQHELNDEEFSPVGELRVDTSFQITQAIELEVGWTGLVTGGITRGSNTVIYRVPTLGIMDQEEEVFIHGLNFGVAVNR